MKKLALEDLSWGVRSRERVCVCVDAGIVVVMLINVRLLLGLEGR